VIDLVHNDPNVLTTAQETLNASARYDLETRIGTMSSSGSGAVPSSQNTQNLAEDLFKSSSRLSAALQDEADGVGEVVDVDNSSITNAANRRNAANETTAAARESVAETTAAARESVAETTAAATTAAATTAEETTAAATTAAATTTAAIETAAAETTAAAIPTAAETQPLPQPESQAEQPSMSAVIEIH
jgi:hypothetical protein